MPPAKVWRAGWPPLAVAAVFVSLAVWSWRAWPDLAWDFGHELYLPWRLSAGETLYRELASAMGPVSPYFNALLFRVFGVSLMTLAWANLLILAGLAALIFRVFAAFAPRPRAAAATSAFLILFGFSHCTVTGNYNFVTPYRHELTHGLLLLVVLGIALVRNRERGRPGWAVLAGVCGGLLALMKFEFWLPAAGMTGVAFGLGAVAPGAAGRWRPWGWYAAGAGGVVALILALLAVPLGWAAAGAGAFGNWRYALNPALTRGFPFYAGVAGLNDVAGNLAILGATAGVLLLGAALAVGLDWLACRRPGWPRVVAPAAGVVLGVAAWWWVRPATWFLLPRPLPFVCLVAGAGLGVRVWRCRHDPARAVPAFRLCLWATLGFLLSLKLLLRLWVGHIGFVHAVPAVLFFVWGGLVWLPARLRWPGGGQVARALFLGLGVAALAAHLQHSDRFYRAKTLRIGSGGDWFWHDPQRNAEHLTLPAGLDYLRRALPPDATLLVLPDGAMFNYLLRKRNPTPYHLLTPWELRAFGGEAAIRARLAANPPDYLVLLSLDTSEIGPAYFGAPGYGDQIVAWIRRTYDLQHTLDALDTAQRPVFQMLVWHRRAPGPSPPPPDAPAAGAAR